MLFSDARKRGHEGGGRSICRATGRKARAAKTERLTRQAVVERATSRLFTRQSEHLVTKSSTVAIEKECAALRRYSSSSCWPVS